jgi:hypothetical protein
MQTWLSIEEFSKLIGKDIKEIEKLCEEEKLVYKIENDKIFIEASKGTQSLIPMKTELEIVDDKNGTILEKTISTILTLHEKVLEAKDETIESLKSENEFLKGSVLSVQEIYDEDRKTIETLQKQLKIAQDELEFCRKKYKLMWGKVIKKETNDE